MPLRIYQFFTNINDIFTILSSKLKINEHIDGPDKAKPSVRRGQKAAGLRKKKMAELSGFVCGFTLSFLCAPGEWARILDRLRQR